MSETQKRPSVIPSDKENFLGPRLCVALNDLAEVSEEFEELVQDEVMTLPDLLEYMEMAGVLDLARVKAVNQAVNAKKEEVLKGLQHIREEQQKTRKLNERFLAPFTALTNNLKKERPVLTFLLNQALSEDLLQDFKKRLEQLELIRGKLRSTDPLAAEKEYTRQVQMRGNPASRNLDNLVWLFAKAKHVGPGFVDTDTQEAEAWYAEHKYDKLHGDVLAVNILHGNLLRNVGVAARFQPTEETKAGEPLNLGIFAISFVTEGGGGQFAGTISRIDGELYLPNSTTAGLKEFLEQRDLGWLYKHIKREVYKTLKAKIAAGELQLEQEPLVELTEGPRVTKEQGKTEGEVVEAVAPELELVPLPETAEGGTTELEVDETEAASGTLEQESEEPEEEVVKGSKKGVRQKLSGLDTSSIIATLVKLGVVVDTTKRGHHAILRKGSVTYPFPSGHGQGKITGNLARILTRALTKFGLTRADFLAAY